MLNNPACTLCKRHTVAAEVCELGTGSRTAEIMVVFETPGFINMGFIGDKMRVELRELLVEAGVMKSAKDDDDIYVTHAVACQHPDGKAPSKGEIKKCSKWLKYQIARVRPKYILTIGSAPLMSIAPEKGGIKKARGKPFLKDGAIILPIYSPGIMKHDERMIPVMKRDVQLFKEIIDFGGIPQEEELDYVVVDDETKLEAMFKDLKGTVAADTETTRLYPFHTVMDEKIKQGRADEQDLREHKAQHGNIEPPRIVAFQFGTKRKQWVIPMETAGVWTRKQLEVIVARLHVKLKECYLVGHNWKFDALWLKVRFGLLFVADFDTMLAHYILDENERHGLKELAMLFCDAVDWEIDKEEKQEWSEKNAKYAAHDVYYTRKLAFKFGKMLKADLDVARVFEKILMPCVKMFTLAEFEGVQIDLSKMNTAEKFLREEVDKYETQLSKWEPKPVITWKGKKAPKKVITPFNWGSPQQVAKLLYVDLDITPVEYTDGGAPSTSESALKQIDHPLVGALLKLRGAKQQLSFFIEGWKPYLDLEGRLHPSFKLHGTVTGRLSCENPNLQQVPRDPRIRSLIIAALGWDMNECDLSQIELRIAGHSADETSMILAFNTGVDVHWLTALREIERGAGLKKEITDTVTLYYKKELKKPLPVGMRYGAMVECLLKDIGPEKAAELMPTWKEFRKKAKAINFGYLYGMWWKKFKIYARDNYDVEVTDKQAQESRIAFFQLYPKFPKWHSRQKRFARLNGYVRSLSGRKRRLPDAMRMKDDWKRQEAERQAINSPIQSFANDLNLMAALQLVEEFGWDKCRVVGTIHDAVLFVTKREWTARIHARMMEIMKRPNLMDEWDIHLKVPIEAEGKIGPWSQGKSLKKWIAENDNDEPKKKRVA